MNLQTILGRLRTAILTWESDSDRSLDQARKRSALWKRFWEYKERFRISSDPNEKYVYYFFCEIVATPSSQQEAMVAEVIRRLDSNPQQAIKEFAKCQRTKSYEGIEKLIKQSV